MRTFCRQDGANTQAFISLRPARRLRQQKENALQNDTSRNEWLNRIRELKEFIAAQPSEITAFDESLVKHLLSKVTVFEGKLVFEFKSGVSVETEN